MRMWPVVRGCWVCWTLLPLCPRSCGLDQQLQSIPGYTTRPQESVLGRIDCWRLHHLPAGVWLPVSGGGTAGRILPWVERSEPLTVHVRGMPGSRTRAEAAKGGPQRQAFMLPGLYRTQGLFLSPSKPGITY